MLQYGDNINQRNLARMMLKLSDNFPKEYHEGSLSLFFYDEKLVDKTKGVIENEHAFLRSPILVQVCATFPLT